MQSAVRSEPSKTAPSGTNAAGVGSEDRQPHRHHLVGAGGSCREPRRSMRTARECSASGARPRWGLVFTWVFLVSALALAAWSLVIGFVTPNPAGAASAAQATAPGTASTDNGSVRLAEVQRALALIEYVIGDYPDAVSAEG